MMIKYPHYIDRETYMLILFADHGKTHSDGIKIRIRTFTVRKKFYSII